MGLTNSNLPKVVIFSITGIAPRCDEPGTTA
jgi:hypothetical protein